MKPILFLLLIFLIPSPWLHAEPPCPKGKPARCRIDIQWHKSAIKRTHRPVTRVSITDPRIADYHLIAPDQILIITKEKIGTTDLIVWYEDETSESFEVRVQIPKDTIEAIRNTLNAFVPGARIRLQNGLTGLMLFGEVDGQETLDTVLKVVSAHVRNFTNLITVRGSQQVQLSVRIAEVSRSGIKQMGLGFLTNRDWTVGVFPTGGLAGASVAGRSRSGGQIPVTTTTAITDPTTGAVTTTTTTDVASQTTDVLNRSIASAAVITSPFASAFQLAVHSLNDDFLAILNVLKGQNLARILASPTLVTMSGQEANFLVGGEFPVPIQGENNQITVDYKTFGVMLRFTPTVVAPETITIQVEPEISNVDYSLAVATAGVSVPGIRTRRGSTTLQLKDGQTFVMAGLLQENMSSVTSKVPFLGDIPYLGTLFTSKEFRKNETEMMIVVTPRLVRALNPDEVPALPGEERMEMIGDTDFFLKNRTSLETGEKNDPKSPSPRDPADETGPSSPPEIVGGNGFAR